MPERFSDFAEEEAFDGDKVKLDEILNKEILVTGYKIKDSHQKKDTKYLTIHFELDGERYVTFTGSTVLMDQLKNMSHICRFWL